MSLDPIIVRHKRLLTDISDSMVNGSEEYSNFVEHMKGYVPRGLLQSKKTLLGKFDALAGKGYLKPGKYGVLKKIATDSGNIDIVDMIEAAEKDNYLDLVKQGDLELDRHAIRHRLLLTNIADMFDTGSPEYMNFVEHMRGYVPRGLLASRKTLLGQFDALSSKGHLAPGKYDVLKKISRDSGNMDIVELIEQAETDMQKFKATEKETAFVSPYSDMRSDLSNAIIQVAEKKAKKIDSLASPGLEDVQRIVQQTRISLKEFQDDVSDNVEKHPEINQLFTELREQKYLSVDKAPLPEEDDSGIGDSFSQASSGGSKRTFTSAFSSEDTGAKMFGDRLKLRKHDMSPTLELVSQTNLNSLWAQSRKTGRDKMKVFDICNTICSYIESRYSGNIQHVWPAYDSSNLDDVKFVLITKDGADTAEFDFEYSTFVRPVNTYSKEASLVMESKEISEYELSFEQSEKIKHAINSRAEELLKNHRNLSAISGNGFRSKGFNHGKHELIKEPCIVLYVHTKGKIPLDETEFPKFLEGIPVDVREGEFQNCALATEYQEKLHMGCQIKSGKLGTLGGFVDHPEYGLSAITCAHVVLSDSEIHDLQRDGRKRWNNNEKQVFQPDDTDQVRNLFGHVRETSYKSGGNGKSGVDLAIVQIESRPPDSGNFPDVNNAPKAEEVVETLCSADKIENCAKAIREELLDTDFKLEDKFCDATDLKESYTETRIPETLLKFLGVLFNFNPKTFYDRSKPETNAEANNDSDDDEDIGENIDESGQRISDRKRRRIKALHQIMYFTVHNGSRRTPLHVMNAQAIHDKCKSRELITSFNHYGLAVSYNELQRYHNDMSSLILQTSSGQVPMPSQFNPEMFTIAAFDNFDHEEATLSGIKGSHDTVSVLFQEKPPRVNKKPNVSETNIVHGSKVFQQQLQCQELQSYIKPAKRPDLPADYTVTDEILDLDKDQEDNIQKCDIAWTLARLDLPNVDEECIRPDNRSQTMPSWSAFNSLVSQEQVSQKIVGFLPVIPSPVTDYQTVFTALRNFQDILSQLNQTHLAVTCDEGVYHIAREITMRDPKEFENIVLCLGTFHMTKIFLGCIGKYLRNSGAESILTENAVFGPNVVNSVLGGTHYVRSFKGMTLLCEAMERLQWCEFFKEQGTASYQDELKILYDLQNSTSLKLVESSRQTLDEFKNSSSTMLDDFNSYRSERCCQSETFKYWDTFILLVRLLRNLVRADREGNWILHLGTVQSILPYFALFDCTNYLRWCSVYLEDMRKLPITAPEIHQGFMQGQFVVKRTPGQFKAVAADQCLEQTINRSQKSSGGIIGSSRKKDFVAEWEMIYHEMIEVSSLHRELSGSKPFYHELTVNHEFSESTTKAREANVTDMLSYIQVYENPFNVDNETERKLHNVITQEVMTDEVRESLLNVKEKGLQLYKDFRKERFVEKSKRLTDTIHRNTIKTFQSINIGKAPAVAKKKKRTTEASAGHRILEISQSRGYNTKQLFRYDLVPVSYLFDEEGLMKKPAKGALCHELEKLLTKEEESQPSAWETLKTVCLIDVMANIRRVNLRGLRTFGDFCAKFFRMILCTCKYAYRIDFVFDSYQEGSIKDTERIRRSNIRPIEINMVQEDTPLPINIDTFWGSISNKSKLQLLIRKWINENVKYVCPEVEIVLSGFTGTQNTIFHCQSLLGGIVTNYQQLDLKTEEADVRLIPHAVHASDTGANRVVLLSADTDVMVLALYYSNTLSNNGITEVWMRAGVGDSTRYIPLHLISERKPDLCMVLPAAHVLTGCDTTSKVGTKLAALKASPEHYLTYFGKTLNDPRQEEIITKAEHYLVKVLKYNTDCTTMDELRYVMYHQSKAIDIHALPPTSSSTRLHIHRCLYMSYMYTHCLQDIDVDPTLYGYEELDGTLVPTNSHHNVPDNLVQICKCKDCSTRRCACRKNGVPCCIYCNCKSNVLHCCKNPHVIVSVPVTL